ncbi:PREDICTED: polymeric immunoglobulin receptor [Chrysochloris asiatica]|uniref:polymeric immunoglobulin receptor n=1 Tax=Chrysochloris asiatica TaxID=185453 RepID=UPI0003F14664|nr:PREDICTED: polymeric immunoglobulin receptor [Chrysochloris asiatica]
MTLLVFLACLLAVVPEVSMKSPIFGPQEVSSKEGKSVSIKCYYPATSVNRHSRKFWCRQEPSGRCITLISSGGFISEDYTDRANLTNYPESNMFVVDIAHLLQTDSGKYKCGLGINNRGLSFDVSLKVNKDPELPSGTQIYTAKLGREVVIDCLFKAENIEKKKSLCKKAGQNCVLVIDSSGYISPIYKGRTDLKLQGTSQLKFRVSINQLQSTDTGMYACMAGEESRNVDLQVIMPEPELVYGDLRGSVNFDCALGSEMAEVPKFLCYMRTTGQSCEVIINTRGKLAPSFEGRILLNFEDNGLFRVLITSLRKEDAGRYVCGAHPEGLLKDGWPRQDFQLFVNEENNIPQSPSVVKGVAGGSVAVFCSYNPKDRSSLKYWCRWKKSQNGACQLLVESQGLVDNQYQGRLALFEEPGNGTYTVILNQLTTQDAGFYWCMTSGDIRWRSTTELKIIEGKPNLKVPEKVTALAGETLKISCHYPCKFYTQEKYWCKWSNKGCQTLPSQDDGPSQAFVNCDQNSKTVSLTLNSVTEADQGWYWCGVKEKENHRYGETAAVYVTIQKGRAIPESHVVSQEKAAPSEEAVEPNVRQFENKAIQYPKPAVIEDLEAGDAQSGSTGEQGKSSTVLISTIVPLALVLVVGAVVVGILRARHRKNVDRISIRSYRTDISMTDLDNATDFGANDNKGISSVIQESSLRGKDETTTETTTETTEKSEESKKQKRSSKEEADIAYNAFLLQSNTMAANLQDGSCKA